MFALPTGWVYSPTDLVNVIDCDLRTALTFAAAANLPGAVRPDGAPDPLVAAHGMAHETRTLEQFTALFGDDVVHIPQPAISIEALTAAAQATREALDRGAAVVYQAVFFDGQFYGRADFLVASHIDPLTGATRDGHAPTERAYEPYDTKLARHARPAAVLQLTAYAHALTSIGYPLPEQMHLLLGDGTRHSLPVRDFLPLLAHTRERLLGRLAAGPRMPVPTWGEQKAACGTCAFAAHCQDGREQARDLSLVAGIRADQRHKLTQAGIVTIDDLAASAQSARPATMAERTWQTLAGQARLQVRQDATRSADDPTGQVLHEVVSAEELAWLPQPSPGDIFFDMEGDPYALGNTGLEYLFGAVTISDPAQCTVPVPFDAHANVPSETFRGFWAHDRAGEKVAFEEFIDFATAHLDAHPGAHIYHYAPYEPSALKRLAATHGTREHAVDALLRSGALVDLYAVVRKALRVSQRSYSIKYLEPLYMPDHREGDVKNAASSIEAYEEYLVLAGAGQDEAAAKVLAGIEDYNTYDCVSTHRLYRWLLSVRAAAGISAAPRPVEVEPETLEGDAESVRQARQAALDELTGALVAGLPGDPGEWDSEQRGVFGLAAAVGYYRRETNPVWWEFFAQQDAPVSDLERSTSCVVPARVECSPWEPPTGRGRVWRRSVTCSTDPDVPHPFSAGERVRLLFHDADGRAWAANAQVTQAGSGSLVVAQTSKDAGSTAVPVAVLPGPPVMVAPKDEAVVALAEQGLDAVAVTGRLPEGAGFDLLCRRPPRMAAGGGLPDAAAHGGDLVATVIDAVDQLDGSYLAVQGPPGAGKTYLATQLIRHLVGTGRTVGVCSTSHKAIENVLHGVMDSPVPGQTVACAKRPKGKVDPALPWDQPATTPALAGWRQAHPGGHLVGGTAWHFAHPSIAADPFDVLIVDEAGQFALTDVLAIAGAARNLVLLGDPQQLPQVVVGSHPVGAEASALGHLLGEREIVPPQLGYFLDVTRRMHPAVCEPVSRLSYSARLVAHPLAAARSVEGVEPGLRVVEVAHERCTTYSPQEVAAVVDVVADLVGRPWRDGEQLRELTGRDVLVVAPFNRQVRALEQALSQAGLGEVRCGTVDRFQGQEAPVSVLSLTASSAADLPRGLDFLLSRNRLNVALSRAQAVSVLVCSPALALSAVRSVEEMRLVSGLLTLIGSGGH